MPGFAAYTQAVEWSSGKVQGQTPGGEPKNFQNRLSSAATQQTVDCKRHKARGCLVLKCSVQRQVKDLGHP